MKICFHITFYNLPDRLHYFNYLYQILKEVNKYPHETDVYIHTNAGFPFQNLPKNTNGKTRVIVHDFTLSNIDYLTWSCRSFLNDQKDDYDIFMYSEDNILIPAEAIQYWLNHKDNVVKYKFNLGFLRVEVDGNDNVYLLDIIRKMDPNRTITIGSNIYIINDINPYCSFWIYDKNEFHNFLKSGYYFGNGNIVGYGIREASAVGLHGYLMKHYRNTIIPCKNGELDESCKIYYFENSHLYRHDICNSSTILFKDAISK